MYASVRRFSWLPLVWLGLGSPILAVTPPGTPPPTQPAAGPQEMGRQTSPPPQPAGAQGGTAIPMPARPAPMPGGRPARDNSARPATTGTGVIRGQVVALDTGQPLRRVQVRLMGEGIRNGRTVLTDAFGRFEIGTLPAGRFTLMATKGGYVVLTYGQRRPNDAGRPIELADGQAIDKIQIQLPRGGVITGRVVDETGETVSDIAVMAVTARRANGRRRLMPAGRPGLTNDIGQYRLYGLPPGEYYVSAGARGNMGMSFGDGNGPEDSNGYAPTYYPGTPSMAEAQRVTVGIGEELNLDLQLIPTRVSHVSGTVTDSQGRPARGMVALQSRDDTAMGPSSSAMVNQDGTFRLNGVPPGSYYVSAFSQGTSDGGEGRETGMAPVTVGGQDLDNVRIVTSKGGSIAGHVTYDGDLPAAGMPTVRLNCSPISQDLPMMMGGGGGGFGSTNDRGLFELKNISAPCRLSAMIQSPGWTLKSVTAGGDDVTDRTIDVSAGNKSLTGVEVVVTSRVTTLTGAVTDTQGKPIKEYAVVAFADDDAKWAWPTRYVRSARPDQEGQFKLTGLPPGEYLVAAVEGIEQGMETDPEFLERVRSQGTKARLSEGSPQNLTLKIAAVPQP